jgi:hypothetical protein
MTQQTCLIRNVAGCDQYIPVSDAFNIKPGERTFTGNFHNEIAHDGPSGSHARTICLPCGELTTANLSEADIKAMGK